ncbi:hypothetical protein LCGC14_1022230 [marine sediment metagenome]|uniref:Uncharacterized protein n=1 Tax=marine sediment metagenome TaxID=412755 RepID=A0A0F9QF95_9ZZZZ
MLLSGPMLTRYGVLASPAQRPAGRCPSGTRDRTLLWKGRKMRLIITIKMDNAAFSPCPNPEVARILADVTKHSFPDPGKPWPLRDVNGNTVGTIEVANRETVQA